MVRIGHVLIGNEGELLSVDAAFCDILRAGEHAVLGRLVLDVTAPADRAECSEAIARLRRTGRPFAITKRFLRDDGSLVWVRNTVSITFAADGAATIQATIEPVEPGADHGPAAMLDAARALVRARAERGLVCDPVLLSDAGWDAVLAAYIAEAEGRRIDAGDLAGLLGQPAAVVDRWVRALLQYGVFEIEYRDPDARTAKAFRLTASTHRNLEIYLTRVADRIGGDAPQDRIDPVALSR